MSNNYKRMGKVFDGETDVAAMPRCAKRLLRIRANLEKLRRQKKDSSLLLATWNIRDFDSNKFKYGPRLTESFYYIAEIISCFDLVALQEINRDLAPLDKVMGILGREWDYIATDTTEGFGGNGERMAFVYNREKVWFRKIAGEIVLPNGHLVVSKAKVKADTATPGIEPQIKEMKQQFARSPFLVTFQSGWFRFSLCTVHIYFGDDSGPQLERRINEINALAKFFADRQDTVSKQEKDRNGVVENYILLGDFNVVSPQHETMKALKSRGFKIPRQIDGETMGKDQRKHFYDQIAVRVKDKRFRVVDGGIVDMFAEVFRDNAEDIALYAPFMPPTDPETKKSARAKTPEDLYRKWRTWQMSDHSPLWIEIDTDYTDDYLRQIAGGADV
ncbi:endonuclease/exonuclease/phosphatase family protein [Rhizobium sp. TRM95111]|uniref:endonuclease/exonuclease/phosphatase family protein n=1 Tax=Rhizobium alarense TaxID=2846851 RepID=UPI001F301A0A|nr:endonuclease/exonuclease/phosphatase family protein [Rhizobium alarense]MCF3638561.1 endonuclease/exonuclease/phosphatase family protein [Rhizobium alarense]